MNILDNDSDFNEEIDAEYVTSQAMSALWDMVISPMEENLSDEEKSFIGVIGITLKLVAHKAKCYEDLQLVSHEKGNLPHSKENDFSRN